MRLHELRATAFGPFAGTVEVDFDELSEAGLFLLTGPTGAGKSSILDAVCFALYGDVPGDRSSAKRLRSDQAASDVAPRVELELSLAGRRFRVHRSPAWDRAKKRGAGTTRQQASVLVAELRESEWVPLATRLDEAGQLLGGLLGMSLAQFTQVALLPQGRFMAFLRAGSDERHQLLQRLFRTGRFEQVERWLRDQRLTLRRESAACHERAADLASRLSEVDGSPLPTSWDIHDLTPAADDGSLRWWSEGVRAAAERQRRTAAAQLRLATASLGDARRDLDSARELATRLDRWESAHAEAAALAAEEPGHRARRETLSAARRATGVQPISDLAAGASEQVDRALAALAAAVSATGPAADPDAAREAREAARARIALARSLQPTAARLGAVRAQLPAARTAHAATSSRREALALQVNELPVRLERMRTDLDDTRLRAAGLPAAQAALMRLDAAAETLEEVSRLERELVAARAAWAGSRATRVALRERWLDLRESRLDGMAAEIAGSLVVGGHCPVCGSCDHPRRAVAAPGSADAASERAARRELDTAEVEETARDHRVRELTTLIASARGRLDDDEPAALPGRRAEARARVVELEADTARVQTVGAQARSLELETENLRTRLEDVTTTLAGQSAGVAALDAETHRLQTELQAGLAPTGAADPDNLLRTASHEEERCDQLLKAIDAVHLARVASDDAHAAARTAAVAAGFAGIDAAVAAMRPAPEVERLTVVVGEHERRATAAATVLAEPGADRIDAEPRPDLPVLVASHDRAQRAVAETGAAELRWATSVARLTDLVAELDRALTAWSPLRAELALVTDLATFVEGKAADNRWQMRLSAYVLAYRLGQVVSAANERLLGMSDQRYALEHVGARGVGETRGGLSLLVRDDWSGERRDPATLSGGETFVVSLALALGLADVISAEAGGVELDTLFVDEGFGSLDADTLDDVMDTLDSLRDGGRVVGVVSHVAEMRDRIPTQLTLTKARAGSSVTVRK